MNNINKSKQTLIIICLSLVCLTSITAFAVTANAANKQAAEYSQTLSDLKLAQKIAIDMTSKVVEMSEQKKKENVLNILTSDTRDTVTKNIELGEYLFKTRNTLHRKNNNNNQVSK